MATTLTPDCNLLSVTDTALRSPLITMSTQHLPWRKMTVC